jgi:hypothetical protein
MNVISSAKFARVRLFWGVALAGLAAMVAGCVDERAPPTAPSVTQTYRPKLPRPPHLSRLPSASGAQNPATAAPNEAAPEVGGMQPEAPVTEPEPAQTALALPSSTDLIGLDERRTTELLGLAAEKETRSPATVWRYRSGRCELDLSFYMEMRSGQMRTLHYDFKGEADRPEQRQACLRSIIEENRKPEHS